MRSVRIWFTKCDTAKYISHLDLTRCFIRAFRRTDIPLWYTEGFNPHPHLVFGLSLPLGAEGINEAVDIRLDDDSYPNERILEELNRVTVNGIKFLKIAEPKFKALDVVKAKYRIIIPAVGITPQQLSELVKRKIESGNIIIEKKTKKKEIKHINAGEYIDSPEYRITEDTVELELFLPAGNDFTINPISFCNSLTADILKNGEVCRVIRLNLFVKDGGEYR